MIEKLKINKKIIILAAIMLLAVIFRFWNLNGADLISDDALYSFRALGWFDYLGGGQTTPIQWFNKIPWWGNLSFHDGPPLVFAVQNIFFRIFGPNVLGARLPFALSGLISVLIVYLLVRKIRNRNAALFAAFLMAISSYAVWISRSGYLEGIGLLFALLSIFFFIGYLKEEKEYYLFGWGLALGLSLLSKYTAVFLMPAAVLYLLIWQRKVFLKKEFWLAMVLLVLVLLPVIIYNFQVFQTRGHFDAALSSMVGMHPEDFKAISSRGANTDFGKNFFSIGLALFNTSSFPVFLMILGSLVYLLVKNLIGRGNKAEKFLLLNFLILISMFLFSGTGDRLLAIGLSLFFIAVALFVSDFWQVLRTKEFLTAQKIGIIILAIILIGEIFYNINTNLLFQPLGEKKLFYSPSRLYGYGFNQLEQYLQNDVFSPLPVPKRPQTTDDFNINPNDVKDKSFILTDGRIDWFAYTWYLEKYPVFYRLPVIDVNQILSAKPDSFDSLIEGLGRMGAKDVYFIFANDESVFDSVKKEIPDIFSKMKFFAQMMESNGADIKEIKNSKGGVAFIIYHLKIN